jgi:hypothetical protein
MVSSLDAANSVAYVLNSLLLDPPCPGMSESPTHSRIVLIDVGFEEKTSVQAKRSSARRFHREPKIFRAGQIYHIWQTHGVSATTCANDPIFSHCHLPTKGDRRRYHQRGGWVANYGVGDFLPSPLPDLTEVFFPPKCRGAAHTTLGMG